MRSWLVTGGLLLAACAGQRAEVAPSSRPPEPDVFPAAPGVGGLADRAEAAAAAFHAGLLPLAPTGVIDFAALAPTQDGRGVLIAILDSGIDPSASGLSTTTDGAPKLLDLRDMSGEGAIALRRVTPAGDTVAIDGHQLLGVATVRPDPGRPLWVGLVPEVRYGYGPGADLDGDGAVNDTLVVVVTRGVTEWLVFADTDRDGTLADERPVRDFAIAREWFGWSSRGRPPPVGVAITVHDSGGGPSLTLVFDNSGHGTHVAGIAAGHDLHGVAGFNGVAPGARLLGLKIANNANRVTTTGSVRRALTHAIAFARRVELPLVINLSFGVGNDQLLRSRIDAVVDSVLDAHPDVVLTVAATNSGPGLGTLGFPATARRVLSVGATAPQVFSGRAPGDPTPDPVAWYSSRGGTRAGPDLVAPGTAWSAVPPFLAGHEERQGTSMAAPHVAGLAARLVSMLLEAGRAPSRALVVQALMATADPLPEATLIDEGAGLPNLPAAARWLAEVTELPRLDVDVEGIDGRAAVVLGPGPLPAHARLWLRRTDSHLPMPIQVRSTASWLEVEGSSLRMLPGTGLILHLAIDTAALRIPGVRVGEVIVEDAARRRLGPLARVPVTVRVAMSGGEVVAGVVAVHAGGVARHLIAADSGVGFRVAVRTLSEDGQALAALHEPGGQPYREIPISAVGADGGAGVIQVDGSDVRTGAYEVVVVAPAGDGVAARIEATRSPFRLGAERRGADLTLRAQNLGTGSREVALRGLQLGIARRDTTGWQRDGTLALPLTVPTWATSLVLDVTVPDTIWSRLTDFGVSLRGPAGELIQEAPLTHPFGRVRVRLDGRRGGTVLRLLLTPAFADAEPVTGWQATVVSRFEVERGLALEGGAEGVHALAGGEVRTVRIAPMAWPLPLPAGWDPLIRLEAREPDAVGWVRHLILASGQGVPE